MDSIKEDQWIRPSLLKSVTITIEKDKNKLYESWRDRAPGRRRHQTCAWCKGLSACRETPSTQCLAAWARQELMRPRRRLPLGFPPTRFKEMLLGQLPPLTGAAK